MTEQMSEHTTQVVESEDSEDPSQSQVKAALQQFQQLVNQITSSLGKRSRESSEPIQIDSAPEPKSKRLQTEVIQQAHEVNRNIIPPGQLQICRKKQESANKSNSPFAEGNSLSLQQISSFAAPEAAPESWLTLANDPQSASFAHMVSIVSGVLQEESKLLSHLIEIPEVQALSIYSLIEKHRAPLERAANLLNMQARAFALKTLMGPDPDSDQALALLHKTEALNAITGDNLSILDVAKFRNLINAAKKITNPGRSAAFPRQYNTFRYSGAVGYNPPTVMRSQPVLGPCFNCGQYGHLRAHCTQTRSMSFNLNSDGGASRRQDFLAYFRKP
jgi:hypothetical protein